MDELNVLDTNVTPLLHGLHRNEHVAAHEDMLGLVKPDAEQVPEVEEKLNAYEAGVERLKLIFKHSPESPETKQISGFDGRRDELWLGGKRIIKLYLNSPDPAIREAADGLRILMNTYGNVPRFSLYGETGSLRHAIDDFKKPANQAKVALVPGFSALIDELETVNNELDVHYKIRLQEAETIKQLGKLADYLPIVDKQLIALFRALNTIYNYNEMTAKLPALKAIIDRIAVNSNALFDQLRKIIDRRSKKSNGKQKPDITNPEVPGTGDGNDGGDGNDNNNGEDGGDEPGDGGDNGDNGEGNTHNPDTTNPPIPPFIPDFE